MAAPTSSRTNPFHLSQNLNEAMDSWSHLWGLPNLSQEVTVRFNGRLRTTVARLLPRIDVIEVGPRFIALRSKRREIICHELAHAAANRRPRRGKPPHGVEWAALVLSAGFDPVSRLAVSRKSSPSTRSRNVLYEHRCLVCQFVTVWLISGTTSMDRSVSVFAVGCIDSSPPLIHHDALLSTQGPGPSRVAAQGFAHFAHTHLVRGGSLMLQPTTRTVRRR